MWPLLTSLRRRDVKKQINNSRGFEELNTDPATPPGRKSVRNKGFTRA